MCNLHELTREDILKAIEKYKELDKKDELNPRRVSKDYNLVFENKQFPPKYIVAIACDIKNNIEPISYKYQYKFDAPKARNVLKTLNFVIERKKDMNEEELISILKKMYENGKKNRDSTGMLHLFAIKYANHLKNMDLKHIAFKATGNESYHVELSKGIKLYKLLNKEQLIGKSYNIEKKSNDIFETKNIILYGVAGVGKTHNTNKLISLIEGGWSDRDIFETIKTNKLSNSIDISDIKERIKFITFHQSFGYEDFIEGFRPNEEGNIELVKGIFREICIEAQKNLDNSQNNKFFNFEDFLNDFIQKVENEEKFTIDSNLIIIAKKKINGEFQSFKVGGRVKKQSLTRDIIERDFEDYLDGKIKKYQDIKPTYESQSSYHGNAPYYFKLYEAMKKYLIHSAQNYKIIRSELKNYYLVIDEINRGNISKIFGELITLIEEDKRDKLEVTLPYSKKPFKIPSNLYIIGTMNSTDKSIALIDIALRRRFTFLKMKPNENLITYTKAQNIFKALNEYITKTLGEDYQIGHSYFMNIESDDDLDFVLEYKIEPLLEEYFYGDEKRLKETLELIK